MKVYSDLDLQDSDLRSAHNLHRSQSNTDDGWDDINGEETQLLHRSTSVERPQSLQKTPSLQLNPSALAEHLQWQTVLGLLLYALCTLCSSGESNTLATVATCADVAQDALQH